MSLRRKQQLCLDAIDHSFVMAARAYSRIVDYARLPAADQTPELDATMVLDAWSFVDVAKRLWSVLHNTPGLEQGVTFKTFVKAGAQLVEFRHYVQHLEDETHDVASTGRPIWGSFSWGRFHADKTFAVGTYVPGRLAKVKGIPVMNPVGREIHDDVDHFEMSVDGKTINVSDLARRIAALATRVDHALKNAPTRGDGDNAILILNLDLYDAGA